jgi:hypothetical protein
VSDPGHFAVTPPDPEQASWSPDQVVSRNLFPPILGLAGIGLLAFMVWALGLPNDLLRVELLQCAAIDDDPVRLVCYDHLNSPRQPARGALGPFPPHLPQSQQ